MSANPTRMGSGIESSDFPSNEFRFFIYDPDGNGFLYFRSAEDRDAASDEVIRNYLDDGWSEEVENVVAGEITHTCEKINVVQRPDVIDDDGLDEGGDYWAEEWDCKCDYGLVSLQPQEQHQGAGAPENGRCSENLQVVQELPTGIDSEGGSHD